MASTYWRTGLPLKDILLAQYGQFDVLQLLRLLSWPAASDTRTEDADSFVRDQGKQGGLRLRFRAELSAGFAGHEFCSVRSRQVNADGRQAGYEMIEIRTANYCIASQLGPLPEPFTEWVRDLQRARAPAMADFLDIFNQRFNLLRYQLRARQTLALNSLPPAQTEHAAQLAAIMGMGLPQLAQQIDLPPRAWLGLAGLLANCRKSAAALKQVLGVYLGVQVSVTEMVGAWQPIEADQHMALGRRNHALGRQSLGGRRVWQQDARIRLQISTLDYARFCQLLPPTGLHQLQLQESPKQQNLQNQGSTSNYAGLLALLRLLLNGMHDCEVQLQLRSDSVPPLRLGGKSARPGLTHGLRLHYSAWLAGSAASSSAHAALRTVSYLIPAFAATSVPLKVNDLAGSAPFTAMEPA